MNILIKHVYESVKHVNDIDSYFLLLAVFTQNTVK